VLGQEGLDLVNGSGEGAGVDSEELGEEVAGAEFAQVEHGGQDSVGGGQLVLGPSTPSTDAFASALPEPSLLT
jgi:hypothetical protein